MTSRPYVLLSVAASLDGCIDDTSETRLLLSNDADFDRVDQVRASVDSILVGANTIRRDNPRLLVRSTERQRERVRRGLAAHPVKVTLTTSGNLDPAASFFAAGEVDKLVYAPDSALDTVRQRLRDAAIVVAAGDPIDLHAVLDDLADRKIGRLLVEGGAAVYTQFLTAGLADEIHLVLAPFFVGDHNAPRFVHPARFPQSSHDPMTLAEVRPIGDVVLLRYFPHSADRRDDG